MEVAAACCHWSQPVAGRTPAPAQTFSSFLPSLGRSRRAVVLVGRSDHRSALFGRTLDAGLWRGSPLSPARRIVERAAGGGAASPDDGFDGDEFARTLDEVARSFEVADDDNDFVPAEQGRSRAGGGAVSPPSPAAWESLRPFEALGSPPWEVASPVPPEWPHPGAIITASVERKANSVELPLSLRMIKRKKQWQEGMMFAGESAYCSVKKAFSSMVFIIRELQSYTLQLRELLFYQDLQGILMRVQTELNASFVWLFQQIFSQTPTLMVYIMILLANFTVYSIGNNAAALAAAPHAIASTETASSVIEEDRREQRPFDQASVVRTYSISGRSVSVGGGGCGGGKAGSVVGATDGGEHRRLRRAVVPSPSEEEKAAVPESEETRVWNAMVEEAMRLQPHINDGVLDQDTMQRFVSPVTVQIPPDDYVDYIRTELSYQLAMAQEPNNPLLLSNYAQFLFLVVHDHDRAEDYFKRAIRAQPQDAESLSRYASFLWLARRDVGAAEEVYLEAIAADPGNTFHASNYAHFLWNTGGEGTCYPLT